MGLSLRPLTLHCLLFKHGLPLFHCHYRCNIFLTSTRRYSKRSLPCISSNVLLAFIVSATCTAHHICMIFGLGTDWWRVTLALLYWSVCVRLIRFICEAIREFFVVITGYCLLINQPLHTSYLDTIDLMLAASSCCSLLINDTYVCVVQMPGIVQRDFFFLYSFLIL